jgi:endo-1,4-beta-D-glucanase Y
MILRRSVLAFVCLSFAACASSSSGGGTGGSPATGGSPSTGGSPGTGGVSSTGGATGAGGAGNGLGTGQGFAFPQTKVTGMCKLTTVANAASATMSAYTSWRSTYVVPASPGMRVQRPENGNDTVSEGIGYGMLAAVYVGDQMTFDGLFTYAKAHFDSKGLMTFCVPNGGNSCSGTGSATDGDEDMIFALLMASDQWSGTDYLTPARAMIQAMRTNSLFSDGTLQGGDNFQMGLEYFPDYFSPAYFPAFTKASGDKFWTEFALGANYGHLMALTGTDGLVPNESDIHNSTTCPMCSATYGYDSCRMPWRITMDYCWNGSANAKMYLEKVGAFFAAAGASNIVDGYSLTGAKTGNSPNLAFIGPAGVAGMSNLTDIAGLQTLLDGAFTLTVNPPGGNAAYFPQSLRVLSMLMMSGNFLDYSQM